jgi:hypothetical protein
MLVWVFVLGYCAWAVLAPSQVASVLERMGVSRRYSDTKIRVGASLFLLFLVILLLVAKR